jgi:hypothetical protein
MQIVDDHSDRTAAIQDPGDRLCGHIGLGYVNVRLVAGLGDLWPYAVEYRQILSGQQGPLTGRPLPK